MAKQQTKHQVVKSGIIISIVTAFLKKVKE